MNYKSLKSMNKHLWRQALDAVHGAALIIDARSASREIVYANPAAGRLLGAQAGELIGRPADRLADHPFDSRAGDAWRLKTPAGGSVELQVVALYEQPGRVSYWLLTAGGAVEAPARTPWARAGQFQRAQAASVMATTGVFNGTDLWSPRQRDERTDAVTGIPGRQPFCEALLRDWAAARREQMRISVVVMKVDALESYFTLFGRHTTDACLRKVAHVIGSSLQRAGDLYARIGHDRFAILVQGGDEEPVAAYAGRIAQRVRDLAIHHPRSPLARYVTVSWSLASEIPAHEAREPGLLELAEGRIAEGTPRDSCPAAPDISADAG